MKGSFVAVSSAAPQERLCAISLNSWWCEFVVEHPEALSDLMKLLERAGRIRTQRRYDKNKLYALHVPKV